METSSYFSHHALAHLVAAQGQEVQKVICHLWHNNVNKEASVELIDNIQLQFAGGKVLTIASNDTGEALDVIDFDYKATAKQLEDEFQGKIKIFAVDASGTKMWTDVIGKTLKAIKVEKEGENHGANSLVLDFGEEKRLVAINPLDGLLIDYHED